VLRQAAAHYREQSSKAPPGIEALLSDPAWLAAHRAMLPPGRRPGIDPLNVPLLTGMTKLVESQSFGSVWPNLTPAEKVAVLSDEQALDRLVALSQRDLMPRSAALAGS
jgi:membrane glycosyltransferase